MTTNGISGEAEMSNAGQKIIKGLQEAVAGNFARVTIAGQSWIKETPLHRTAPEMLEALKAFQEYVQAQSDELYQEVYHKIHNAIAKAEGRESLRERAANVVANDREQDSKKSTG